MDKKEKRVLTILFVIGVFATIYFVAKPVGGNTTHNGVTIAYPLNKYGMPVETGNGRVLDHFAVITYDNKQINSVYFQGQTRKVYHNTISVVDNFSQPQDIIWYGDRPYRIDLY